MLETFRRSANYLQPLKWPALFLSTILFAGLGWLVLSPPSADKEPWIKPILVALLWSGTLTVFLTTFRGEALAVEPYQGVFQRLGRRLRKLWLVLIAMAFVFMTLVVVHLTLKLLLDAG